jgi:hypothetical protein
MMVPKLTPAICGRRSIYKTIKQLSRQSSAVTPRALFSITPTLAGKALPLLPLNRQSDGKLKG